MLITDSKRRTNPWLEENIRWREPEISELWLISMLVRQRPLSVSCITLVLTIKLVILTKAQLPWTGWSRSRREVSRSHQPLPPVTGLLQDHCKPKAGALEHRINIIDTPGHVDFTVEVERSLRVLDGAVGVFCAKGGVEPQSENVWRQADTYNVPRMAFINKMDILGANFYGCVDQIRTRLGKNAICLQLPIGKEDEFKGIIDLFEMQAYIYNDDKGDDITVTDIPEDMKDDAELYRTELVEKICELDDDLMMMYLDGEEPSVEELKKVLRKATCECQAIPVCCGTAYRNKGVQKLLDAVIEFMPSPLDIPPIKGVDMDGNEIVRHSSDDEPFSALAFKIMTDPFVGKLAFFRVYSGTMNSGSYVLNATKNKKERVGRILQMHANKRQELDKVYSGDIAAAVGFKINFHW